MKNSKNSLSFVFLILLLSFALVACGSSDKQGEQGGDLVFAKGSDAVSLDSHGPNDNPSSNVATNIYEGLVYHDENGDIQPRLAESFEAIDDVTWEFNLRQGVKFHDGSDFNAEVVKANLDRVLDEEIASQRAFLFTMIEDVVVVDEYTVRIITEYPFSPLLAHLGHSGGDMMSLTSIEADYAAMAEGGEPGSVINENPIGTGLFKFQEWIPGDRIVLVRNDDYWGEPAKVDSLTFEVHGDDETRFNLLETGDAHLIFPINANHVPRAEGTPNVDVYRTNSFSLAYIAFNLDKEPFDDVRVRQAISMAINRDSIINGVLNGIGIPANGPLSEGVFGYSEELEPLPYDVDKAKELLAEAGYPDGFSTTIWTNDNQGRMDTAENVQEQLKQIGIDVSIQILEWGAYLENTAAGEHDMFILGWGTVTADADYGLYALFHSDNVGGAGNRTFIRNDRLDDLLDRGRRENDVDARLAIYKEAQEILVEEAPMFYSHFLEYTVGIRDEVEGFWKHPNGLFQLGDVTIK